MPTGIDAGSAYISVVPDASGFATKLKAEVAPQMAAVSTSAKQSMSGLVKASGLAGTAVGLAWAGAGIAITKFAADSVASYREHQVAVTNLQTVLAKMPKLAGETTKAFEDQATAIQNLTGYQDEEVLAADTVLARFDLTGQQIRDTIPLIADYARATGTDMAGAADVVGKALLGNTRALKQIGIQYKVTGDAAKDFANISTLLEQKVGGTAEAFGRTSTGKMDIFLAKVDDLKEAVGAGLVPILDALTAALGGLLPVLTPIAQNLPVILGAFLGFKAITFLPKLLTSIAVGFESLGALKLAGSFLNMGVALESVIGLLGPFAIGIGAAVFIGTQLKATAADTAGLKETAKQLNLTLAESGPVTDKWRVSLANAQQTIAKFGPDSAQGLEAIKLIRQNLESHGVTGAQLAADLRAVIDEAAKMPDAAQAVDSTVNAWQRLHGAMTPVMAGLKAVADATQASTDKFYANATAALALRDAQLALQGGLLGVIGASRSVTAAHEATAQAEKDLAKARQSGDPGKIAAATHALADAHWAEANAVLGKKNAVQSYANTLEGPLKQAQLDQAKAQQALNALQADPKSDPTKVANATTALANANRNLTSAQQGLLPAQQRAIKGMNDTLRTAGYTEAQIHKLDQQVLGLIGSEKGVPSKKATQFSTPGLDKAIGDVGRYKGVLASVPRSITTIVHAVADIGAGIGNLLGGHPGAEGGVFKAARGVTFRGPGSSGWFLAGEASYPTPLGTGAEVVTGRGIEPLANDHLERIADFLAARMERGFSKALWTHRQGTAGGEVVLRARGRDLVAVMKSEELWRR